MSRFAWVMASVAVIITGACQHIDDQQPPATSDADQEDLEAQVMREYEETLNRVAELRWKLMSWSPLGKRRQRIEDALGFSLTEPRDSILVAMAKREGETIYQHLIGTRMLTVVFVDGRCTEVHLQRYRQAEIR